MEALIPDVEGNWDALATLVSARPDVLNHDVETVPWLWARVRSKVRCARSLELLRRAKVLDPVMRAESGLIVGLGATRVPGLRHMESGAIVSSSSNAEARLRAHSLAADAERTAA